MISDNVPGPSSEAIRTARPLLRVTTIVRSSSSRPPVERSTATFTLLLANPVSRRRVVLEKLLALVVELAVLGLVLWVALVVGGPIVDLGISTWNAAAATLAAVLLALLFGCVALLVGAASGIVPARSA
jgi:ABC-2 type transport system permease protein